MLIDVLLFGPQAAIANRDRVTVEIADGSATTASVMEALRHTLPKLAPTLDQSRLAVNHAYAGTNDVVSESDEVALIGMVSGG